MISIGYDGTVSETQWAKLATELGSVPHVVRGLEARNVVGVDRGIGISAGAAAGHGVLDENEGEVVVQCDVQATGVRWDTVCLRRDWSPTADMETDPVEPGGASTFVVVKGTSARAISSNIESQPGVLDDTPLYLARVEAGSSVIDTLDDLRVKSSALLSADRLSALPNSPIGTHVKVGSTTWIRRLSPESGAAEWWNGQVYYNAPAAYKWEPGFPAPGYRVKDGIVQWEGAFKRDPLFGDFTMEAGTWYVMGTTFANEIRPDRGKYFVVALSGGGLLQAAFRTEGNRLYVRSDTPRVLDRNVQVYLDGISWSV
ncbi:hypothetical protein K0651_01825 [Ornithinimicrobium sp. Arc0846-15]|nr:hypothetical protein [Ornithinimicrobium laminariae]